LGAEGLSLEAACDRAADSGIPSCPSCGRALQERFCPHCGEKKFDPDHLTLRHFFEQVVEVFTHADNRFFRSFKLLITRPGFLTNEYMNGRRKPYLQPVQLFLVANLLFFFVQTFSVLQPLTTALWLHTHNMPYQERAQKIVDEEISRQHLTLEEYSARFNAKEETESKAWVIVMVPCLAVVLALVYVRKHRVLVKHLVFSFHFHAFALLVLAAMGVLLSPIAFALSSPLRQSEAQVYLPWVDRALTMVLGAVLIYYLYRSIRAVYSSGKAASFLLAWVFALAMFEILLLYRRFLFYVTVHALS